MKKMIVAAFALVALVGCGGPLEDDGTGQTTGSTQQALDPIEPGRIPGDNQGLVINHALLRNPAETVVGIPAFQERQHLHNPFDCKH